MRFFHSTIFLITRREMVKEMSLEYKDEDTGERIYCALNNPNEFKEKKAKRLFYSVYYLMSGFINS